jgi:hypothetical protein
MPAGYSKRSLVDKLGIKPNCRAAIVHAPNAYRDMLGALPPGVTPLAKPTSEMDFIQAFFSESRKLDSEFPVLKKAIKQTGILWISWPKKASKMQTDLTEDIIRVIGLRHGLVDVKVCAVDEVWSGLKFMYRLKDRSPNSN